MHVSSNFSSFKPTCLEGKVALISGGRSGIGRGITKKFMQLGCTTIILSRNMEELKKTADELEKETGGKCMPISADVRDYKKIEEVIEKVLSLLKKIDILVNCAAGNFLCSIENLSLKGFKTVMEIDAYGVFILSQILFKKYFKYNGGIIINISMTLHHSGTVFQLHAGAAKAAIDTMTKHMAVEWGPYNVRVNAVAPGPIKDTVGLDKILLMINEENNNKKKKKNNNEGNISYNNNINNNNEKNNDENNFNLVDYIPLQRYGTGEDIGNIVAFLCLPESSYITGSIIFVDGGQSFVCNNHTALFPNTRKIWLADLPKIRNINSKL